MILTIYEDVGHIINQHLCLKGSPVLRSHCKTCSVTCDIYPLAVTQLLHIQVTHPVSIIYSDIFFLGPLILLHIMKGIYFKLVFCFFLIFSRPVHIKPTVDGRDGLNFSDKHTLL